MADETFDELLEQARQLPPEDQLRLVQELSKPAAPPNGASERSMYDVLKARGLIGFMTDGPPDLSTNPKYLEGLGQDA